MKEELRFRPAAFNDSDNDRNSSHLILNLDRILLTIEERNMLIILCSSALFFLSITFGNMLSIVDLFSMIVLFLLLFTLIKSKSFLIQTSIVLLVILFLIAIPFFNQNTSLSPGAYIYIDSEPIPESTEDVREPPIFEKYEGRLNLLYISQEEIDRSKLTIDLYYLSGEEDNWQLMQSNSYSYFSGNRLSVDLFDATIPTVHTGRYRTDIIKNGVTVSESEFELILPSN